MIAYLKLVLYKYWFSVLLILTESDPKKTLKMMHRTRPPFHVCTCILPIRKCVLPIHNVALIDLSPSSKIYWCMLSAFLLKSRGCLANFVNDN